MDDENQNISFDSTQRSKKNDNVAYWQAYSSHTRSAHITLFQACSQTVWCSCKRISLETIGKC